MKTVLAVAVSAVVSIAAAQSSNFTIDPNTVDQGTRVSWCTSEFNACQTLCPSMSWKTNNCDYSLLTYSCVCTDGSTPDLAAYTGTLPYFLCTQSFANCIKQNENDAQGQQNCKDTHKCGTKDVSSGASASSSSSSSSSASATTSPTSSASATSKPNAAASEKGMLGTGLLAGAFIAMANALL